MKFSEIVDQARALLQQKGRITYRALKLEFDLDAEQLEALKEELLYTSPEVVDDVGRGLVWTSAALVASSKSQGSSQDAEPRTPNSALSPVSYTPAHLAERILAEQVALEARGSADGERKTITALFADLKGSTALIEGLDPEEARAIIDPALQLMMDAVHRYEGYVAQALGDGIFALFGAPIAHEDHPQRALYAALRMQEDMRRYADTLRRAGGAPLQMRVGVNTGEVVVRSIRKDDLHTDYVPVGHSTNLAARMEQLANPSTILVTEHTYKLTEGYFQFKALGETQVKGVEKPLPIYEVLGIGPLRTRLQVAARRGLTRFVGRQAEREQIRGALAQATAGHGQIVGVMGEPGVGKSRLFYEFKLVTQSGCLTLEAFSVSHGKASPYLPLIELLKNYFQITLQDDDRSRREKVLGKVLALDRSLEDTLPYLLILLGVADPHSPLQQMLEDPQVRRRRTFDALKRLFIRESLNQPLILIFEDLHWLDSETQAFLTLLSESVATARMLLLVNYRPEYHHEWGNKTYYTQLRLDPLGQEDAQALLSTLLGDTAALQPLKQLILAKTEGNPFFMEEVVQTLVEEQVLLGERGNYRLEKAPTDLHISPTVQGILTARIDRLAADEKELLQTLAVIGREFSLSLLSSIVARPEAELYRLLSHLQGTEFIYEQSAFPEVEYIFKHALTQEVAYNSLLLERRKVLHERTAQAIEGLYRQGLEDHYSELAHHYSRSGNTQKAVEYLGLAGQQAVQRSANVEAISYLTAALELLKTLPDTPERAQQELTLQVALGVPLMATKGWPAPEVERAYIRARDLCEQLGETRQLFSVLRGLWECYELQGKLVAARELGEQLLSLAQNTANPALLLVTHNVLADNLFWEGQFVATRAHAEQGTALYDRQQHHVLASLYGGYDPGVACLSFEAVSLWALGYPDRSSKQMGDALTLAQELPHHPYILAFAQTVATWLSQWRREGQAVLEHAEAVISLSTAQEFPLLVAFATVPQGWALARQGEKIEGLARIHQGLALYRAIGGELVQSYFLALLAETYGEMGQMEEGLAVVAEALDGVYRTGEHFWEAELYRLKGTLTLQKFQVSSSKLQVEKSLASSVQSLESEVEECFLKAIEVARKQQAKSLELRAVMSLSRLWQQQGKKDEARQLLAGIYGWFTEGFDTKDLQEAQTLLAELAT
jgi:class 3 adenylate cyclase/predicted ATPase